MYILLIKFSRECTDTRTYFIDLFIIESLIIVMIYFLLLFFCYS